MSAQSEMTVRQLPDGTRCAARERSWDGTVVEIELLTESGTGELDPGALAEIESTSMIYLGAVTRRQDSRVLLNIEHAIDRTRLSRIQETWNQKER